MSCHNTEFLAAHQKFGPAILSSQEKILAIIDIKHNCVFLTLLLLGTSITAAGANPQVKAGGVTFDLPSPADGFVEVGDRLRTTVFDLFAPSNNRLLTAYVPALTLDKLNAGMTTGDLDAYGMIEVSRQAEYAELTTQAFQKLLESMGPALGKLAAQKIGDVTEEINIRLKSLGNKPIEVGHPEMLGQLFEKTDASGFAMLMAVKADEHSDTMATGFAVLRVKNRLLFAYLYRKYESAETVNLLRKNLDSWTDAILASNK